MASCDRSTADWLHPISLLGASSAKSSVFGATPTSEFTPLFSAAILTWLWERRRSSSRRRNARRAPARRWLLGAVKAALKIREGAEHPQFKPLDGLTVREPAMALEPASRWLVISTTEENHDGNEFTRKMEHPEPRSSRPAGNGRRKDRPRGYLPAKDDPDAPCDAKGESNSDREVKNVSDALKQRGDQRAILKRTRKASSPNPRPIGRYPASPARNRPL